MANMTTGSANGADGAARRAALLYWLRRTHGWFGLWGALFGLMLGISGVWLNHRATLKLDLPVHVTYEEAAGKDGPWIIYQFAAD